MREAAGGYSKRCYHGGGRPIFVPPPGCGPVPYNPLEGVDIEEEYALIKRKKSKLSASQREEVVALWEERHPLRQVICAWCDTPLEGKFTRTKLPSQGICKPCAMKTFGVEDKEYDRIMADEEAKKNG